MRQAEKTDGTVVGYKTKTVTSGKHRRRARTVYMPIVEYAPNKINNQKIKINSTVGSSPPAYNIGEIVTVYFFAAKSAQRKIKFVLGTVVFSAGSFLYRLFHLLFRVCDLGESVQIKNIYRRCEKTFIQ